MILVCYIMKKYTNQYVSGYTRSGKLVMWEVFDLIRYCTNTRAFHSLKLVQAWIYVTCPHCLAKGMPSLGKEHMPTFYLK